MVERKIVEEVLGEYNPDGTIKREPVVCAVTGRRVVASTPTVKARIPGTDYFYRTIALAQMTEERLKELKALIPPKTSHKNKEGEV